MKPIYSEAQRNALRAAIAKGVAEGRRRREAKRVPRLDADPPLNQRIDTDLVDLCRLYERTVGRPPDLAYSERELREHVADALGITPAHVARLDAHRMPAHGPKAELAERQAFLTLVGQAMFPGHFGEMSIGEDEWFLLGHYVDDLERATQALRVIAEAREHVDKAPERRRLEEQDR